MRIPNAKFLFKNHADKKNILFDTIKATWNRETLSALKFYSKFHKNLLHNLSLTITMVALIFPDIEQQHHSFQNAWNTFLKVSILHVFLSYILQNHSCLNNSSYFVFREKSQEHIVRTFIYVSMFLYMQRTLTKNEQTIV